MLIRELDDGSLMLLQATPRKWLEDGKRIEVKRAPTCFGELGMRVESAARDGTIRADVKMPTRTTPKALIVRLRHPQRKPMRSVAINGHDWKDFDPQKEWVRIPQPTEKRYSMVARFAEENR
jgi:hypothetical protein